MGFRIHATRNLPRIGKALGPLRTREELVPFVVDSTDDEDEVLLALAEAIGAWRCVRVCVCVGSAVSTFGSVCDWAYLLNLLRIAQDNWWITWAGRSTFTSCSCH